MYEPYVLSEDPRPETGHGTRRGTFYIDGFAKDLPAWLIQLGLQPTVLRYDRGTSP